MASQHSMDIVVKFDKHEMDNAIDQARKEAVNRYDLKDAGIEIEFADDDIKLVAGSEMSLEAVFGIIVKKMAGRGLSHKILDRQKIEEAGGMKVRQHIKLVKVLDSESAKELSKKIRDAFPKAKPLIQGDTVRVTSGSIDELQEIIAMLRNDETVKVPLEFTNYR
ncbi:MAG: YajQ family cyclic di-GMP-binding protein [Candidatus Gracilibacteria bacterium]|nr:YajQ family cyclic di-GMP-binding protein [Candidatus Gracilibacteria bacterium]